MSAMLKISSKSRSRAHLAAGRLLRGSLDTNLAGRALISALGSSGSAGAVESSGDPRGTAEMVESLSPPGEGGSENGFLLTSTTAHGVAESSSGSPRSIAGGGSSWTGLKASVDGVDGSVSVGIASSPDLTSFSSASVIVTPAGFRSRELKISWFGKSFLK